MIAWYTWATGLLIGLHVQFAQDLVLGSNLTVVITKQINKSINQHADRITLLHKDRYDRDTSLAQDYVYDCPHRSLASMYVASWPPVTPGPMVTCTVSAHRYVTGNRNERKQQHRQLTNISNMKQRNQKRRLLFRKN